MCLEVGVAHDGVHEDLHGLGEVPPLLPIEVQISGDVLARQLVIHQVGIRGGSADQEFSGERNSQAGTGHVVGGELLIQFQCNARLKSVFLAEEPGAVSGIVEGMEQDERLFLEQSEIHGRILFLPEGSVLNGLLRNLIVSQSHVDGEVFGHHQDQIFPAHLVPVKDLQVQFLVVQDKVNLGVLKQLHQFSGFRFHQGDFQVRVLGGESGEQGWEDPGGEEVAPAEVQGAGAQFPEIVDEGLEFRGGGHNLMHRMDILLAALGELQGLGAAVEKGIAHLLLNPFHIGAQRRLRDVQLGRRLGKTLLFINFIYVFHSLKHDVSLYNFKAIVYIKI